MMGSQALADDPTRANSVEVGGRQVTGVAAGTQSTDAVNLGQLQAAIAGVGGGFYNGQQAIGVTFGQALSNGRW